MGAMASLLQRIWLARGRRAAAAEAAAAGQGSGEPQDPVLVAGSLLRQAREARGLTLRQVALETRISTPVLEALERGWLDRLPEAAYLRTMLPLLERHLQLEPGCLRVVLPESQPGQRRRSAAGRIPWVSVQLFTTWQGTALYGVLMLALLYGVNLEQRRLVAAGLLALAPVPPLSESVERTLPRPGSDLLLEAYPDLSPLGLARQDRGWALLRRAQPGSPTALETGVLELSLSRPSQLTLQAAAGQRLDLKVGPGELVLPLTTPLQLSVQPPPTTPGELRWNGQPLEPEAPGRYRWPRAAAAASSP